MRVIGVFAILAALVSAVPFASAAQQPPSSPAQALQSAIAKSVSSDQVLQHYYVNVWVKDGFVSLTGLVQTDAQRDQATALAKAAGAASITNTIIVNAAAKTREEMEKLMGSPAAADKPKEAAK